METTIAKLRNAISPAYTLADMVLMIKSYPEMQSLCIKQAKKTIQNQNKISKLLKKIESEQAQLEKTSFTKIKIKNGENSTRTSKINAIHAKTFGIQGVSDKFYGLIDRLQKHSEWKYPERKWSTTAYYEIALQWKGREAELEKRVIKLETEINQTKKQ